MFIFSPGLRYFRCVALSSVSILFGQTNIDESGRNFCGFWQFVQTCNFSILSEKSYSLFVESKPPQRNRFEKLKKFRNNSRKYNFSKLTKSKIQRETRDRLCFHPVISTEYISEITFVKSSEQFRLSSQPDVSLTRKFKMTETAAAKAPKAPKKAAAKAPKTKPAHPPTSVMIVNAVTALKERNGKHHLEIFFPKWDRNSDKSAHRTWLNIFNH